MVDERADDEMIEIGDPDEEPTDPEPSARVVIEYRERGVPWMLIPPLLIISALGAVLLYHKLAPEVRRPQPSSLANVVPPAAAALEPSTPADPILPTSPPAPVAVEKAADVPPVAAAPPAPPIEPVASPFELPEPVKEPETAPFPRVQGLGFDPRALEAERKAEPLADPSLAPARDVPPDDLDQPREVDPDLLPPDPRLARARQKQREAEAIRKVEADRVRFHSDLAKVCKKFGESSGPEILKLFDQYDVQVEPTAQKRAVAALGKTGQFVGADRATRIALLRSLGYPEPAILSDLCEQVGRYQSKAVRGGLNSKAEVMYLCALYLLKHAPPGATNPARPASSNRASAGVLAAPRPDR